MARQPALRKRFAAEIIGSFLLVFIGAGSATSATLLLRSAHQPTTIADLLLVALAHGLAFFAAVMIVGRISGAHINPAVTVGLAAIGRFPWDEVIAYVTAQAIGAVVGAACIFIVFGTVAATDGKLGAPVLAAHIGMLQGAAIEALGAAIVVISLVASVLDRRTPVGWWGFSIGMSLTIVLVVISSAVGPSVNPARSFGPYLVDLVFGVRLNWGAYLVTYLFGPLLGGIVGARLYAFLLHLRRAGERQ